MLSLLSALTEVRADGVPVDYRRQIKPIFKSRCYACHGALKQESNLRLDTGVSIRKGGDGGAAVVPKNASKSLLVRRITATDGLSRMPPEGIPLTPAEIALIKRWIAEGAKSPAEEKPEADPREHWAFVKPVRAKVPRIDHPSWGRNPIDSFVASRHQDLGLKPLPPARKPILLRRVYLDLIGLPPTREELVAFSADRSPAAYDRIVDRLLNSPQYGERWGRHWMDVWRYSDWYGRRQVNDVRNSYPHIWRWRDWIINSLNSDKGYDQMIREMLAADEMYPDDDSRMPALGFIVRNWFSLNYHTWKQDLVEHTGKAFLGLRLNCAHCHDHKYDPISQKEYFRFRAFFEPLEFRHDRVPGGPPLQKYLRYKPGSGSSLKPIKAGLARVYDHDLQAKTFMYRMGDTRDRFKKPPVSAAAPAILGGDKLLIHPVRLPPAAWYPGLKTWIQKAESAERESKLKAARAGLRAATQNKQSKWQIAILKASIEAARADLQAVRARIAADNARYKTAGGDADELAKRASLAERRAKLAAAILAVAVARKSLHGLRKSAKTSPAAIKKAEATLVAANKAVVDAETRLKEKGLKYAPFGPQYPKTSSGRRRALANWIASKNNPLTARVAINHIWMRHFGRPLVESVFDFGRGGKRPTHPQLLDWLAVELMANDWSMKRIHRLIVTSSTYRLSSRTRRLGEAVRRANNGIDKDNTFLWKGNRRRMEAEVVRDSLLHVAGILNTKLGGPEIGPKNEATVFRRSLYFGLYPEAGGTMPFLEIFDPPNPGDCYRRTNSIVPQQALAMSNSKLTLTLAKMLAGGLTAKIDAKDDAEFITAAFEQILSRSPTNGERMVCREFLEKQIAVYTKSGVVESLRKPRARRSLVRVLLNHNDFVTVH